MGNTKKLTGYITLEDKKFAFIIDGFIGQIFNGVTGFCFSEKIVLPSVLYGITDENYDIAIHINSSLKVPNCIKFSTDYYAIGNANAKHYDLSKFEHIEFIGGTCNCILDPEIIYGPPEFPKNIYEEGCSIKFRPIKEVEKKYNIVVQNIPLTFQSTINPYQDRKENKLGVTNSGIILRFNELQDFDSFGKWYWYVDKIAALLVKQQNIAFEKIILYWHSNEGTGYSRVYVNHGFQDIVEKKAIRTISIRTFDRIFSTFSQMIDEEDFSINFLPDNNLDAKVVTYETVKNICTAVEFEFQKSKIKKDKDPIIGELIKKTRALVEEYHNSTPELTDKAYQAILGNISHWTFPATEQFNALYNENKEIIDNLITPQGVTLSEELIQQFIQCRNDITHGKKPSLTEEIVNTAYGLKALIYVSLFKRIGLTDDELSRALEFIVF